MYLKRLEVTGFKSFAGKSVLDFSGDRTVTAIVGPNGSGKSNVADSIRWVLGETSYKTVRAKKSEDVIFSGSNGKSKASGARVSMILDNADGKAPIDFTEVEIERAVYRDGSSEYLINGKKARLLDVAELLARSGFGQSTYSVIGQGMVDSMLFYGPAERKVLFDEAAGVRSYEIKREQTIRKLTDTAQNVIRIKDILSELNPRLNTLRRQAERAKQKGAIEDELFEKQKVYFASVWDKLSQRENEKRAELDRIAVEENKIKDELAELNKRFEKILGQEKSDSSKLDSSRNKINTLEDQKDKLKQEIYTRRAQLQMKYSDSLPREELEEKMVHLKHQLDEIEVDKREQEKKALEGELEKGGFDALRQETAGLEAQKEELRQQLYTLRAKIDVSSPADSLTAEEIKSKLDSLNAELNDLKIAEKEREQEASQKEIDGFEKRANEIQQKIESKKQRLATLSEELSSFDFGVVGEELGEILETQNLFLIKIESAEKIEEVKKTVSEGRKITSHLEKLMDRVSGADKGVLSSMTDIQSEIEALSLQKEESLQRKNEKREHLIEAEHAVVALTQRRTDIKNEIEKLRALQPVDESDKQKLNAEANKFSEEIEVITAKIEINRGRLSEEAELKRELANFNFVSERESQRRKELEQSLSELAKVKPIDEKEKKTFEQKIEELESEVEKINLNISEIRAELDANSNDFSSAGKQLSSIKDEITRKQSLVNEYVNETTNIRVELARIETKKQDIKEEIVHDLGSEAELANAKGIPELDEGLAQQEIDKLKNKIYAIGEIDAEVENEYGEVEERVTYLTTQMEDLEKAKADLEKLISDLDVKIKKQFEVSFSSISGKFTHFFELLFGGGEAKLELVHQKDEDGAEEKVGIEITAVPPGKKVRSLSALSGGERTLTSLALLFAILSVNPAPFILLDEVDAALDEPNTKRFLKIVHELSKETQFIFITHNRETMKECSIIYGVTMDDTHVSKLLSVRLEEAAKIVGKEKK